MLNGGSLSDLARAHGFSPQRVWQMVSQIRQPMLATNISSFAYSRQHVASLNQTQHSVTLPQYAKRITRCYRHQSDNIIYT